MKEGSGTEKVANGLGEIQGKFLVISLTDADLGVVELLLPRCNLAAAREN